MPNTSSPGASVVTPLPTASTTPATSQPTTNGGSPSTADTPLPDRVFQSTGLTPAATTRTSTSVGRGSGRGRSTSSSTSGPPNLVTLIARMVASMPRSCRDVAVAPVARCERMAA